VVGSLGAVALLPLFFGQNAREFFTSLNWPNYKSDHHELASNFRILLVIITVLPILAITLYSAFASFSGSPIVGPIPASFFSRIGDSKNYLLPLSTMFLIFIAHAHREKSSRFAFAAALLLNLTITLGYLLHLVTNHHPIGPTEWINLLHFNVIASATFALG